MYFETLNSSFALESAHIATFLLSTPLGRNRRKGGICPHELAFSKEMSYPDLGAKAVVEEEFIV